jgi:hypothetical protein
MSFSVILLPSILFPLQKHGSAGTAEMAYALNCPIFAKEEAEHAGSLPAEFSLCQTIFMQIQYVRLLQNPNQIPGISQFLFKYPYLLAHLLW